MSSRLLLALAVAAAVILPVSAKDSEEKSDTSNPFFDKSPLQFQYPPFDRIRDADYAPAFDRGMAEHLREIAAIADNAEPATFDNTIVALERSGQTLSRVSAVFFNLTGANTNDAMEAIQSEYAPKLSAHQDAIALDAKLFARVKALHDARETLGLDPESLRLLERYHTDFIRAGANLSDTDKERVKAINGRIATLQTDFSQNLLKENNASAVVVDSREQLAGLPDDAVAATVEQAKARKLDGKFVLALQNTSGQPALASLDNRALRETLMKASLNRASHGGEFDNRAIIAEIVKLRAERAALLGYADHASYVLEDQTAKTTRAVNDMLGGLAPAAVANARREAADMQAMIDREKGGFQLAAWDWAYYAEKVRREKYAFDESELRPYFEMNHVLVDGVFHAATQLYGITFKERKDLPVYQADVRVFEVFDTDGSPLALFLVDWYARDNKRGGAWMNEYVSQSGLMGTRPVIGNHLNIPKPPAGEPTLLTYDEVTTAFHEFGHALHGMFSNVKYPRFAGTNVPLDFVEYPSQVNEMWASDPAILKNYAKHHETGEPLPQALLDKVLAAEKFNQGYATTEYLGAALLDQAYHQLPASQAPTADAILGFEAAALKKVGLDYAPVPPRYRTTYFSHIVGGYAAGYYAYLWSEVLDAESVKWFEENGGLKRANGDHFRKTLLSRGGSADAMQLFRDFRGRDPQIGPLLERRGLEPK
ncbi:M3 family metallopeptidase [Chiayiivirga flava]|uniref:Peptidyl-dipeptidase Dcp n=1 Tax=Chiayiivirga flava TaxID=659595 RepID=A0A7W8D277_9GAMM|nr:M3 family metallopeptidase [Chiayiivirga flava]MBB5206638.1 peptidyl-dipeptidase Dcp [Chiayiivirga flava]